MTFSTLTIFLLLFLAEYLTHPQPIKTNLIHFQLPKVKANVQFKSISTVCNEVA